MRNTIFGDASASIVSPLPEVESGKQNSPADFLQRTARRDGEDLGEG